MPKLLTCPPGSALADAFGRFWRAYPPRTPNPRARAEHEFCQVTGRLRPEVSPEQLVQAAEAFAAECRRLVTPPEFIPHARTWLAHRRWLDQAAPGQAAPGGRACLGLGGEVAASSAAAAPGGDVRLQSIAEQIGHVAYATWIAPLAVVRSEDPAGWVVRCARRTVLDRARTQFGDHIRRALAPGEISYEVSHG